MEKTAAPHDSNSENSPSDHEKHTETNPPQSSSVDVPDPDAGLSDEERAKIDRALLWKLDIRLIPWLCLLYLISFLGMMISGQHNVRF
jgi:hypothetical protein